MRKFYVIVAAVAILMTSSCGMTKKKLGLTRSGPDETLVQTNNPLILPPEYNVRPKKNAKAEEQEDGETNEDEKD